MDSIYKIKDDLEKKGQGLKRDLKQRDLCMISIGGVIATGIFVGSGYSIAQAGPLGAVLVYSLTGIIMYITMRCLGEMAVFMPIAGSFQTYASKFISPGAGFSMGWFFWLNYAITIPFELVISGQMMSKWVSTEVVPVWAWATIFAAVFIVLNIFAVKYFGEAEFWFCSVKVVAILLFIILGVCQLLGILGPDPQVATFGNYIVDGTLFPTPLAMIVTAFITVAFSYNGTELIGLAAGESNNPEKALPRAINNTAWRTILFYVGSIVILTSTIPWQKFVGVQFEESPFVMSLQQAGFGFASDVMNFVVITAALSCGNSLLFGCMRLLFGMSKEGQAPKFLGKVSKSGVPVNGLIFTMIIVSLYQLSAIYQPSFVALVLMAISSLAGMMCWSLICLSQIMFRKKFVAQGGRLKDLKYKTLGYPYLSYVGLFGNLAMILSFIFLPGNLPMLFGFVPLFAMMWIGFDLYSKRKHRNNPSDLPLIKG